MMTVQVAGQTMMRSGRHKLRWAGLGWCVHDKNNGATWDREARKDDDG
jgi:hypothetical protein